MKTSKQDRTLVTHALVSRLLALKILRLLSAFLLVTRALHAQVTPPGEPITLRCLPDRMVECGIAWSFDPPTATSTCTNVPAVTVSVLNTVTNAVNPRCPGLYAAQRTWRAVDGCGHEAFCSETITVLDSTPPTFTCGPDKEVQCGTDWAFDIPTATDVCDRNNVLIEVVSTVTNVSSARCPKLFSVTRTWRATDTCGNSAFCNQTVTIVDTVPPHISC